MSVVFRVVFPILVVVFDLILPIALLLWALRSRARSRLYLASILISTAVVIAILAKAIVGFWYVVGVFWPGVYLVAFARDPGPASTPRVSGAMAAQEVGPRVFSGGRKHSARGLLGAVDSAAAAGEIVRRNGAGALTAVARRRVLRLGRRRQRLGQPAWRLCAGYREAERPRAQRVGLFSARS